MYFVRAIFKGEFQKKHLIIRRHGNGIFVLNVRRFIFDRISSENNDELCLMTPITPMREPNSFAITF